MCNERPFTDEQREVLLNAGLLHQVLLELKVGIEGAAEKAFLCRLIADAYIANQKLQRRLEEAQEVLRDIAHRQSVAIPAYCLLCGYFVGEGGAHADKCKLAAARRGGEEKR